MAKSPSLAEAYAPLYIRDYRLFVAARFCITLAIQIQSVCVAWQVYDITKSKLTLGLINLAEVIPSISIALIAGHVADTVKRKNIIVVAIFTLLFCSASLLIFSIDIGSFILANGILPIYAVIFVSGLARGFLNPAAFSFMPQLVTRELYPKAVTLNSTIWQAAAIAGPALGGFLYGLFKASGAYIVDASLVIVSFCLFIMIPSRPLPAADKGGENASMGENIRAGLRFVFSNQIILSALSLDLFAVLFGGAVALLPVFASDILHTGPLGLGLLRSAPWIGAVIVAIYVTHNPIKKHTGKILLGAVAGFGMCMVLFALSTNFILSIVILAVSGAFDCVSVIVRGTLLQTLTPENMKGRVSSVNNIFIGSSNEIGGFESGVTAEYMGTVPAVIFGGIMTIIVVIITGWKAVKLRNLEKIE